MYFSQVKIIGKCDIAKRVSEFLSSLGYNISPEKPNLYIVVGEMEKALEFIKKKAGVILISCDGEYVIPLKGESKGVSFIASIISDFLSSNLILTSKFSQIGLYSVEEFAWINALYPNDRKKVVELNRKLLEKKRLYIYTNGTPIITSEEFIKVEAPCEADIIIGEGNCKGVIFKPMKMIVGLHYIEKIPQEVLLYSIKMTMKSIFVNENRVDVIVTPVNDRVIRDISKLLNAEYRIINADTCEGMLYNYGGKILLKSAKRSYGVFSCLASLYL